MAYTWKHREKLSLKKSVALQVEYILAVLEASNLDNKYKETEAIAFALETIMAELPEEWF